MFALSSDRSIIIVSNVSHKEIKTPQWCPWWQAEAEMVRRSNQGLSQWCILHIPPISTKKLNFSPLFHKIHTLPTISAKFTYFASLYVDHDAFMHHTLHVAYWTHWKSEVPNWTYFIGFYKLVPRSRFDPLFPDRWTGCILCVGVCVREIKDWL